MARKSDYHAWCDAVRALGPSSDAAKLMTLAEDEYRRHDLVAKATKRPEKKNHTRRSFQDCVSGMRQLGGEVYHLYDDFTPHVLNRGDAFFLFPTVREGCERYGRPFVHEAPSVGIPAPSFRKPQEWKWGPQNVLLTPAKKTVIYKGSALRAVSPGVYVIEVERGGGSKKHLMCCLTVRTPMTDSDFRSYVSTLRGKIDILTKAHQIGYIGGTISIGSQPRSAAASAFP